MFDHETNTVFFASCLKDRYPEVFHESAQFLKENGVSVRLVESSNLWCRDYMPAQTPSGKFSKFKYIYDRRYPWLKPPAHDQFNAKHSPIVLDGGNCQRYGEQVIMTTVVLKQNPGLKLSRLEEILQSEITLIPC